jgi:GDPmannose 4,6-dehydratase
VAASAGSRARALITGISGQDGSLLAELLLSKDYDVVGMVRRVDALGAAQHLRDEVEIVRGDLLEPGSLRDAIALARPRELYHLAAPTFVPESWQRPAETLAAIAGATATLLEAVRDSGEQARVFVAVSSEIFGAAPESPQREEAPCHPQTPYATAKLAAHQLVGQFRSRDGIYACSGILYNHESERRPERFVTRKLTRAAAAIKLGLAQEVALGDLDSVRDWSAAEDVMRGAWLMLQQERPRDYILASGTGHTVAEFAELAFARVGLNAGDHIRVDPGLVRPPEAVPLVGDPARARRELGWEPTVGFEDLVARMVDADLRAMGATVP